MGAEGISPKQARVLELRKEYLQKLHNPYRHMTGEGGHIFDSALYRFQAMRVSHYDHFKPTFRSFKVGFLTVAGPIIFFATLFKWDRNNKEEKFRTGQVAYKDRLFKFI